MANRTVVIDLRPAQQYAVGHLPGAHSFPWPIPKVDLCRLPPRECPLRIVVEENASDEVCALLERLGFDQVELVKLADADPRQMTVEVPRETPWSPNPFLAELIREVESLLGGPGVALDAGSGAGRDMVFLALRGWAVLGIENRIRLIHDSCSLAAAHGTDHVATGLCVDVARGVPLRRCAFDLLTICPLHSQSLLCASGRLAKTWWFCALLSLSSGLREDGRGTTEGREGLFSGGRTREDTT